MRSVIAGFFHRGIHMLGDNGPQAVGFIGDVAQRCHDGDANQCHNQAVFDDRDSGFIVEQLFKSVQAFHVAALWIRI